MPKITTLNTVVSISTATTFVVVDNGLTRRYAYGDLKTKLGIGGGFATTSTLVNGTSTVNLSSTGTLTLPGNFIFKRNGGLTFPDNTVQTTAYTGGTGGTSNSFGTIAVLGQDNVVADSATDTLTLIAGTNVTIITSATNDSITINASGSSGFATTSTLVNGTSTVSLGSTGILTLPVFGDIVRNGVSVLGGGGFATTSTLVNGTSTVSLGSTGILTLPVFGDIVRNGVSVLGGSGFATTSTLVNGTSTVTLSSTGTLTLPVFGDIVRNGVSVLGGGVTLPSQTGNSGKYLTTNGSALSWATVAGGGFSRNVSTGTTTSISNNTTATIAITGFKSYSLLSVQTSAASWVRLYTTSAARSSDSSRVQTTDPIPGSGVIAEVITSGNQTVLITPGVFGFNNDDTPATTIYAAVTNLSGSPAAISVTLKLLQLEA